MNVIQLMDELKLTVHHLEGDGSAVIGAAYCGDLLSDVMAHAPAGSVWFTIQAHVNIVAVAQLREVACVVLVNNSMPDANALEKARKQGVTILGSTETSATLCMRLAGRL